MRIGQILHDDPARAGGVQTHVRLLCEDLGARGHAVHAFAHLHDAHGAPRRVREDGWSFEARERPGGTPWGDEALDRRLAAEAVRWARARRLHVVHVHHLSGSGPEVVPALRAAGFATVATLHDLEHVCARGQMWSAEGRCSSLEPRRCADCMQRTWPEAVRPSGADEALVRRRKAVAAALSAAHALVVPSAAAARLVAERWQGEQVPALRVVANGVRAARLAAAVARERAARRRGDGRVQLGFLGALLPSKGVLELAQAVKETGQEDLVLRVHGAPTRESGSQETLRALSSLASACPRIVLHGPCPPAQLPQVLAELDALAMPSLWDEFHGLALREGLAAGLWPVATDRGGLADAAVECPGALQLPADRPQDWAWLLRSASAGWRRPPQAPLPREAAQCARELEGLYAEVLRQHSSSAAPATPQS